MDNVPLPPGGTVALQATAQWTGGATRQMLCEQEREPIVFTQTFGYELDFETTGAAMCHIKLEWARGAGGTSTKADSWVDFDTGWVSSNRTVTVWPADNGYLPLLPGQQVISHYDNGQLTSSYTNTVPAPTLQWMEKSASAGKWPENFDVNWSESSDREVRLFTGGNACRQRQGLFDLSASLIRESELDPNVPDWGELYQSGGFLSPTVPPVAVPSQQISLGALGNLGNDGHLYTVQSSGREVVITLNAPVTSYSGGLPLAQKYQPHITLSTATTSANLDTDTPEVCVGEKVTFTLNGLPMDQIVNMRGQWNLPQEYVNEPYPYSSVCTDYRINNALLVNTNATSCWYQNKPGGRVSVGMNLLFSNGQNATVAAGGGIVVVKPSIDRFNSSFQTYFNTNNGVDVSASMDWQTYVRPPPCFSGTATYAQIINRDWVYYVSLLGVPCQESKTTDGEYWLDNSYPYPEKFTPFLSWNDDPEGHADHSDSPGLSGNLCSSIILSDQFQTYLQFQPATSGSIAVTICRIDWGWLCNATESNGIWTWNMVPIGPTCDWDDDSFPLWPDVYHND